MTDRKKPSASETKWIFKSVALALLQGNAVGYAENPQTWANDAWALTNRLLIVMETIGVDLDGTENS
jgi:hypothetical protein